eukprot:gene10157-9965_t
MKEGYYRENLNAGLLARYRIESSLMALQPNLMVSDRESLMSVALEIGEHFIYALKNNYTVKNAHLDVLIQEAKPIEKQVKNLTGVKKVTSNSFQDYSVVIVEFNTDVKVDKAKQDVKDGVDKAKQDLPQNLPFQPEVKDIDFSEFPILNVNVSGDYDLARLKKYADKIQDAVEAQKEIKRVDLV